MDILPELPRKIKKHEAKVTIGVLKWLKKNYPHSCAFEIKSSNTNTIREKALQDHQRLALQGAKSPRGIIHKLSDEAQRQQPFDGFQLVNTDAFVIACFPKKGYCLVYDVDDWHGARFDSKAQFVVEL